MTARFNLDFRSFSLFFSLEQVHYTSWPVVRRPFTSSAQTQTSRLVTEEFPGEAGHGLVCVSRGGYESGVAETLDDFGGESFGCVDCGWSRAAELAGHGGGR